MTVCRVQRKLGALPGICILLVQEAEAGGFLESMSSRLDWAT